MKNILKQMIQSTSFHVVLFIMLSIVSLQLGNLNFSLVDLFKQDNSQQWILWISRLPRLLAIVLTGASLSITGLITQTIHANRFVSPSTMGTMDFARLGILVSILFFNQKAPLFQMAIGFVFAFIGTFLFIKLVEMMRLKNKIILPLLGLIVGNIVSALTNFIAYQFNLIQVMTSRMQGSFSLIVKGEYELLYIALPFLILAILFASRFTIAGMGKTISTNLGLKYSQIIVIATIIVSMISASVVVSVGTIPFVGLIIPNMASLIKGDNLKNTIGFTALLGINFLLLCDLLSRILIYPYEVAISVIISVFGSILLLNMIVRSQKA